MTPFTNWKILNGEMTNADALETLNGQANHRQHTANLALMAFGDRQGQPGAGSWSRDDLDASGRGLKRLAVIFHDRHTLRECIESRAGGLSLDQSLIVLLLLIARMSQAQGKIPIIGQEQEASWYRRLNAQRDRRAGGGARLVGDRLRLVDHLDR